MKDFMNNGRQCFPKRVHNGVSVHRIVDQIGAKRPFDLFVEKTDDGASVDVRISFYKIHEENEISI